MSDEPKFDMLEVEKKTWVKTFLDTKAELTIALNEAAEILTKEEYVTGVEIFITPAAPTDWAGPASQYRKIGMRYESRKRVG